MICKTKIVLHYAIVILTEKIYIYKCTKEKVQAYPSSSGPPHKRLRDQHCPPFVFPVSL